MCRNVHPEQLQNHLPPSNEWAVERYNRTIRAALRTYVAYPAHDWDPYTDALTYAYNCEPYTSTDVAPLEGVLYKPPGPLALKPMPSSEERQWYFKQKWKHLLQDTLAQTKERLTKAQERDKKNHNLRFRKKIEVNNEDDYVYLRVDRNEPNENRDKISPIAECPYKVTKLY